MSFFHHLKLYKHLTQYKKLEVSILSGKKAIKCPKYHTTLKNTLYITTTHCTTVWVKFWAHTQWFYLNSGLMDRGFTKTLGLIHNGFTKTLGSYTTCLLKFWAHTQRVYQNSRLIHDAFTKTLGSYTMGLLKLWLIHNGFSKTLCSYTMGLLKLWAHTLWV